MPSGAIRSMGDLRNLGPCHSFPDTFSNTGHFIYLIRLSSLAIDMNSWGNRPNLLLISCPYHHFRLAVHAFTANFLCQDSILKKDYYKHLHDRTYDSHQTLPRDVWNIQVRSICYYIWFAFCLCTGRRSSTMPLQLTRLLPFVFTGIVFSIFLPVDAIFPGGGPRPPPLYPGGADQFPLPPGVVYVASDLHDLLNRFIAAFLDALRSLYAFSTTSSREGSHGAREPTNIGDYRAILWASARAQGWARLDIISQRALSDIGFMSTTQAGTVLRQEETYVRRLIARVLLEVFTSLNHDVVFSPAIYDTTSSDFARSENSSFSPILDGGAMSFVAMTIANAASLATAAIHLVDEDVMIAEAFHGFASNPSSWTGYIQSTPRLLSIREIMRQVHRFHAPSSRALPIIPNQGGSFPLALFRAPVEVDPEAANGPFALYDEDIEYIAALFVAVIIRFHRRNGIITA